MYRIYYVYIFYKVSQRVGEKCFRVTTDRMQNIYKLYF